MRKWIKTLLLLFAVIFIILTAGYFYLNEPLPSGKPGADADLLAQKMLAAIHHEFWDSTGAVTWTFRGVHHHLWDKKRHYARVRWEDYEVLLDISRRSGIAYEKNSEMTPAKSAPLIETAWKYWANDSFWLNPISKIVDPGTSRQQISSDDEYDRLLVTFTTGGVTPGDSYLWILDKSGLPIAWKMWVSILPLGGIQLTWENWMILSTGVKISTHHKSSLGGVYLQNVKGAATLADLEPGTDPFLKLVR